jgi:ABC-type amino acid transport substrate-binding protein
MAAPRLPEPTPSNLAASPQDSQKPTPSNTTAHPQPQPPTASPRLPELPHSSTEAAPKKPDAPAENASIGGVVPLLMSRDWPSDIQHILNRKILNVGMCAIDQPPFHEKDANGKFSGFDVDLAANLAKVLKVVVNIIEGNDWDSLTEMLINGQIDVAISNLSLTPERGMKILCSQHYARIRQCLLLNRVLIARACSQGHLTLRQVFNNFSENSLLIQSGTACVDWAKTLFPKAKISTTDSWDEIINRIKEKKVLGTISDELEIKKRIENVQSVELMPIIIKGRFDLIVIGVANTSPQLLHFINTFLESNNIQCTLGEQCS